MTTLLGGILIFAAAASPAPAARVEGALEQPMSATFVDTPLKIVLDYIRNTAGLAMTIEDGVALDVPVNLAVRKMTVRSVLVWATMKARCGWGIKGNAVVITTPARAARLKSGSRPASQGAEKLTVQAVAGERVLLAGGPAAGLIVGQKVALERKGTPVAEIKITRVYSDKAGATVVNGEPMRGDEVVVGREAWLRDARERLARAVSFTFKQTPLTEALALVALLSKLSVMTDPAISMETKLTLTVKDLPLEQAMKRLLDPARLTFELRDEALFVRRR